MADEPMECLVDHLWGVRWRVVSCSAGQALGVVQDPFLLGNAQESGDCGADAENRRIIAAKVAEIMGLSHHLPDWLRSASIWSRCIRFWRRCAIGRAGFGAGWSRLDSSWSNRATVAVVSYR